MSMCRISRQTVLWFLPILIGLAGNAQTNNTIFGSGYSLPVPIPASPGDVINVFVQGVGSKLTQPVTASGTPLPTTLGGISVSLYQSIRAVRPRTGTGSTVDRAAHFDLRDEPDPGAMWQLRCYYTPDTV